VDDFLLLDYGIKLADPPEYPLNGVRPRIVIPSHGHLDHCGLVPNLCDLGPAVLGTKATHVLTRILSKDTLKISKLEGLPPPFEKEDINTLVNIAQDIDYGEQWTDTDYTVELRDAGHIPGSSQVYVNHGDSSLLYTGDFNDRETLLQTDMEMESSHHDVLVTESTYFGIEHSTRREVEERLIESIRATLDRGGSAIVPCFAIGRTQEILLLLERHGIPRYLDGMGINVTRQLLKMPEFLRNHRALSRAFEKTGLVRSKKRRGLLQQPSVVVCTAGMLDGGPVQHYLRDVHSDPRSMVLLTGYQVEDTNGRMALETGQVLLDDRIVKLKCGLEQYDFSAHADQSGIERVIKNSLERGCEKVICMHGDRCQEMAEWVRNEFDVEAHAPVNGDELTV